MNKLKEALKKHLNSRGWVEIPYKEAEALLSNLIEQVIEDIPDEISRWHEEVQDYEQYGNGIALKQLLKSKYL